MEFQVQRGLDWRSQQPSVGLLPRLRQGCVLRKEDGRIAAASTAAAVSSPAAAAFSLRGTGEADLSSAGGECHHAAGFELNGLWSAGEAWSLSLRGHLGVVDGEFEAEAERLYLEYARGPFRLRLGRQAVAWGAGWFFRPTDLITPRLFLGEEEGRPGRDLVSLSFATSALTAVEFAAGEDLLAARAGWEIGRTGLRLLGLKKGGVKTLGCDLQGGLAGFYLEAAYEWTEDPAAGRPAALLGWNRTIGGDRLLYLEYLHDERGRFFFGRNYLAAGLEIPRDELTTYTLAALANLDDGGVMASGLVNLVLSDRADLRAGAGLILGPKNSEFALAASGARLSLSAGYRYYF